MIEPRLVALVFHGEQALLIAIPILVALVALGIWFVVWFCRKFRYWNTRRKYISAGALAILVVGTIFAIQTAGPNTGPPEVLPASEISKFVNALPAYAHFSYSGLGFFAGKLYVTSNMGLIEVVEGKPVRLFRVQRDSSVVSGPWVDTQNKLLWILDEQTRELLRFDANSWKRFPIPQPEKGYYSRGDILQGVRMVHDGVTLWMHSGGSTWRWDDGTQHWVLFPGPRRSPTVEDADETIGVTNVEGQPALIVRHQGLAFLVRDDEDFKTDTLLRFEAAWKPIPSPSGLKFLAERWVNAAGTAFVCTRTGGMLKVTRERVEEIPTPGPCEALVSTAKSVLVSFRGQGIFEFTGQWKRRAEYPHEGVGDYWLYLAENGNEIAVAVQPKPVIDKESPASTPKFRENTKAGLWMIKDNQIFKVGIVSD